MAVIWWINALAVPFSDPDHHRTSHHQFARELADRGHRVVIITSDLDPRSGQSHDGGRSTPYFDESQNGVLVRSLRGRQYGSVRQRFLEMVHFGWAVVRNSEGLPPPDLVVGKTVHHFAADAGRKLAKRHSVPFVLELGDIWPRTLVEMGAMQKWHPVYWLLRGIEIRLYRSASRIVSNLPLGRVHVDRSHADGAKVVHLPNSVDMKPYMDGSYPPLPSEGPPVVVYAGGMSPIYCLENLIDAAVYVARERPDLDARFRLIGKGRSRAEIERYAEASGASNVEFVDEVPIGEVPAALGQAQVCVDISLDLDVVKEFGMSHNKTFEYLGSARPIVFAVAASNNPIRDAGAGVTCKAEDGTSIGRAIIEILSISHEERVEMGKRGQQHALAYYTNEAMAQRLSAALEEVLAGLAPGSVVERDYPPIST